MAHQLSLLKDRRFGPLFVTMFLGAFNDNLFKTTLVVLLAYSAWDLGSWKPEVLVSLSAALFILPYILVAPLGGGMADKFDKAIMMRWLKMAEIVIALFSIMGLWLQSLPFLFVALLGFGVHSALFSPPKYAIVPQQMKNEELIAANALLNTGSFIAILAGNILGSLWGVQEQGHITAFGILLVCALAGYIASRFIPSAPPPEPSLKLRWNVLSDIFGNFRFACAQPRGVMASLLGIAWFYFVGGTYLAQFPNFARHSLNVDNFVLSVFMAVFTLGIAIGGMLNNMLLASKVSARYVGWAAFGIALFSCDLFFAAQAFKGQDVTLDLTGFLARPQGWRVLVDILMVSLSGGIYVVPLNAILQKLIDPSLRARVLSVSNVMDAAFMLVAAVLGIIVFGAGYKVEDLIFMEGIVTIGVGFYFLKRARILET